MQDDFKVTPSPSEEISSVPQASEPAPLQDVVPQQPQPTSFSPNLAPQTPMSADVSPVASDVPPTPAASPKSPMSDELARLLASDPGPVPPATSMNFTPGQVGPPSFGGGSVMGGPTGTMASAPASAPKNKWVLPGALIAALIVILAGAYFFALYLPNTPSHVYSSSISNSGLALDKLVQYSQKQEHASYSTTAFTGTVQEKSPSDSFDATLNGSVDKNANANMQFNADLMGEKVSANILSIKAAGNTAPDVYVQVNGIKSMLDSLGLNSLDKVDGQWISIDHTLVETYLNNLATKGSSSTGTAPTYAEVEDAIAKVQTVNKQYLFSTNASTAVFSNAKFDGKQASGGRTLDHYTVGYNKAHLNAYLTAVGQALNSSQLNSWYKNLDGKNLSDGINIASWQQKVNSAPSNYTFDMWADTKTKLIAKISFTDPSNKSSVFSVEQNYTGGDTYPFVFGFTGKDSSGEPEAASVGISVNTDTNKMTFSLTDNVTAPNGMTNVTANISATPSNTPVNVTAPKNAESIDNLLLQLGLGNSSSNTSSLISESTVHALQAKK
jgi:hypothetical protein